jgi:hypothetical protein
MKLALGTLSALVLLASAASAGPVLEEHVTNGAFDLPWTQGFYISWNATPATLDPGHPAYANPSGDHTVMLAATSTMDSGNVVMSVTDPNGMADYIWEGWVFTGDGTSNKGLVVRGDPGDGFENNYNFILRPGLFELRFRRMDNAMPVTLASWFATDLPAGSIPANTWHKMKIAAVGNTFRCFFDEFELTTTPIVDATYPTGWVGIYHFKFQATGFEAYFDDLILNGDAIVPTQRATWAGLKSQYR